MSAADVTPERFAELRLLEKHLCASGQMVGACLRESLAALESAWAERDAYLEEVLLTNENEARIMADLLATREERDRLRAELAARSAPVAVEVPETDVAMIRRCLDECAWDDILQPIVDWTDRMSDAIRSTANEKGERS